MYQSSQQQGPFAKSSAPSMNINQQDAREEITQLVTSSEITEHGGGGVLEYNANEENETTTKIVKVGSIILFIGTAFVAMFLIPDLIGGAFYYGTGSSESPHNPPVVSFVKFFTFAINVTLLILSGLFGLIATNEKTNQKSKYSLLHIVCLTLGIIVFVWELAFIFISFFTTGYPTNQNSYGYYFIPILIVFTVFSVCGIVACGVCCVSGIVRYININSHTREVSI